MNAKDIEAIGNIFGKRLEPIEKQLGDINKSVQEHTKLLAGTEPRLKNVEERSKSNSNKIWGGLIILCSVLFGGIVYLVRSNLEWITSKLNGG